MSFHMLVYLVRFLIYCSVYETYYLRTYLRDYSPSTVAWIGSIQAWVQLSATLISGPVSDRYGPMVSPILSHHYHLLSDLVE